MGLFNRFKKTNDELEALVSGVENNASNNYKDAAQEDFRKFLAKFDELKNSGSLNEKQIAHYDEIKNRFEVELKGFHH